MNDQTVCKRSNRKRSNQTGILTSAARVLLVIAVLVLAGCGAEDPPDRPGVGESGADSGGAAASASGDTNDGGPPLASLTVGLMPAVDTAPFFVAADAGYFRDAGLDVTFQIFTNAQDRQSALQTGQIDGAMTDLVAVAVNVAGGFDIRATMLTDGMFPVLAQPGLADALATADSEDAGGSTGEVRPTVSVGLMEVSVSNFLVDQWLAPDYELEKVFINAIPARLEAVASGQLDMGLFPEPIASVGEMRGLEKLLFQPVDGFSPDVIVFTGAARDGKAREISAFHDGYNRAVADIAADPEIALDAIITHIPNVSGELREFVVLPEYHPTRLPDREYLERIVTWTRSVVDGDLAVDPASLVDRTFVDG